MSKHDLFVVAGTGGFIGGHLVKKLREEGFEKIRAVDQKRRYERCSVGFKQVLTLAFNRLAPGDVLFTIYDPTPRRQLRPITKILLRIEYYIFKIFYQSFDLPKAIGKRLRRMLTGASVSNKGNVAFNSSNVGVLAECHVEQGIDDLDLVSRIGSFSEFLAQTGESRLSLLTQVLELGRRRRWRIGRCGARDWGVARCAIGRC